MAVMSKYYAERFQQRTERFVEEHRAALAAISNMMNRPLDEMLAVLLDEGFRCVEGRARAHCGMVGKDFDKAVEDWTEHFGIKKKLHACERLVPTGLVGAKAHEVLEGIHGQLSDGIWENDPACEPYWMCSRIDGTDIIVSDGGYFEKGKWVKSGFIGMSDDQVRLFFAARLKDIVCESRKDFPDSDVCVLLSQRQRITLAEAEEAVKKMLDFKEASA